MSSVPDLSKANEKNAKLTMKLSADSGSSCATICRVSANQWAVINAICDDDKSAAYLIASLAHYRSLELAEKALRTAAPRVGEE